MAAGKIQILAFVGAPASGKTEAANVARELGIPVVTMGDVVREEVRRRGLEPNDENTGRVASELRAKEGMDAIAKRCIPLLKQYFSERGERNERAKNKSSSPPIVVVDGIRGLAEVETFKRAFGENFMLVGIQAPLEIRYKRVRARRRSDDFLSFEEFKRREEREKSWGMEEAMRIADKIVRNEGSLEEFKREIRRILRDLLAP